MRAVCPDATLLQYVNPMAINTWAIAAKYPAVRQVGLCHSVQGTAKELADDLGIPLDKHGVILAQLRHVPAAERSEKAPVKDQDNLLDISIIR